MFIIGLKGEDRSKFNIVFCSNQKWHQKEAGPQEPGLLGNCCTYLDLFALASGLWTRSWLVAV